MTIAPALFSGRTKCVKLFAPITSADEELAAHCSGAEFLYMAIDGRVYDITSYVDQHPGGVLMMTRNAGLDVTAVFNRVGCATL